MSANPLVRLLNYAAFLLLAIMAAGVLVATPLVAWAQLKGTASLVGYVTSVAIAVSAGYFGYRLRHVINGFFFRLTATLSGLSERNWLLFIVLTGIILRLGWTFIFPASPVSDGATYLMLAQKIAAGLPYETAGTRAYWPPGYAFFLMPWVAMPVHQTFAIICSNLLLYGLTIAIVTRLADFAGGMKVARLSTLLLALWPTYVANAGMPEKENLLVLLLPLAIYLYTLSRRSPKRSWHFVLASGLVLGFATLVQPSIQLFFTVFVCYEIVSRTKTRTALLRIILVLLGMTLVIAPWTLRNISVFNEVVPITTNGGDNFYRANNGLATGAYTERGEVDLSGYAELEKNKAGFRLARQWIAAHPQEFFGLMIAKQTYFLGDDSTGIYNSLKRGGHADPKVYFALKTLANAIWYGFWITILCVLIHKRRLLEESPVSVMLAFGYAYFFVLHSIFESASKYHTSAISLIVVLFSIMVVSQEKYVTRAAPQEHAAK